MKNCTFIVFHMTYWSVCENMIFSFDEIIEQAYINCPFSDFNKNMQLLNKPTATIII